MARLTSLALLIAGLFAIIGAADRWGGQTTRHAVLALIAGSLALLAGAMCWLEAQRQHR